MFSEESLMHLEPIYIGKTDDCPSIKSLSTTSIQLFDKACKQKPNEYL